MAAFVPLTIYILLCSTAIMASATKEKTTHLHFYFHDKLSEPNPTAARVASGPSNKSQIKFGDVFVFDDPLTSGPSPTSGLLGRARGSYIDVSLDGSVLLLSMTLVFVEGKYNGSKLAVIGEHPLTPAPAEIPVLGGSGLFRLARGYAILNTYSLNQTSGDAIVEYNVTIFHR